MLGMSPLQNWFVLALVLGAGNAQLQILAPKALAREFEHGMVYGTTATFGAPYYGERVVGQLLFAESNGKDYCEHGDYTLPHIQKSPPNGNLEAPKEAVKVLLVRRGRCTFVTKVRVAQDKGANAVIVVDRKTSSATSEDIQKIVMANDGWGDSIKIPSMLVSRFDGEKLIKSSQQQTVMVELAWDIPRGEVVTMDFWMSSGSREAARFMDKFKAYAVALGRHLQFAPHYHIFTMDAGSADSRLCISEGQEHFCAPDPDGDGSVTGGDVANEDVRQLCIWNLTARRDNPNGASYSTIFWQYIVDFNQRCRFQGSDRSRRFGEECSQRVMGDLSIDKAAVQECAQESRLQMLRQQLKNVAWSSLALRLNGWRYSGPLDPQTVLKAVCGGYTTQPRECEDLQGFSASASLASESVPFAQMVAALALLASVLIGAFFFYKRHLASSVRRVLREEVMLEVQSQMADYVVMEDGHRPNQRVLSF